MFEYRDGALHCEDVSLETIAERAGTPVYVYSLGAAERAYDAVVAALAGLDGPEPIVCYAVKANGEARLMRTLAARGAGADVVSGGELSLALASGFDPGRIVYSGVGKTDAELRQAVAAGVTLSVEAHREYERLSAVAAQAGREPAMLLRVNPDVEAGETAKVRTAGASAKFGIPYSQIAELYARAAADPAVRLRGLSCHLGSQIADLALFERGFARLRELAISLRGAGRTVDVLDVGGGLPVPYGPEVSADLPTPADWGGAVRRAFDGFGVQIIAEPGRRVVAESGVLLARVIQITERPDRSFAVLDAGMNDLLRPAMYDAWHGIDAVRPRAERRDYDVVGPVCESSDVFGLNRRMPVLAEGDHVAIRTAGAYGAVMASRYNARPLVAEVTIAGGRAWLSRPSEPPRPTDAAPL